MRAVELAHLLALGDHGADARPGKERRNAGAARADALGERALGIEFDLKLAREVLLRERLVLAHVRRDHLLDLFGIEQQPEAYAIDPAIVGDDRQALDPGLTDRIDQGFGNATQPEAAGHDQHAVPQQPVKRRPGVWVDFSHVKPNSSL